MEITALREALKRHRIERAMSYEELAQDIASVVGRKHRMSFVTVQRFIEGTVKKPDAKNLYAFEQYLRSEGVVAA